MSPSADPPFDPQQQGISLDELADAFAEVMGVEPRRAAESPAGVVGDQPGGVPADAASLDSQPVAETPAEEPADKDDCCPISPRSILEAMLFVGNRDNRPLSPARAAELMRDVEPDEIPSLVDELNRRYAGSGAPYRIASEGEGYRLRLGDEFDRVRSRFYGRIRQARLSQAAIDVLALVAYQQPITGEKIGHLRGKPSSHVLAHLVHRGLLRIERPDPKRRTPHYYTTDRFLRLFNMQSVDDLPRSEDAGPP
jgi:segregation and condensation protein B